MAHNHASLIAGIKNLLRFNYGYAGDEIDLEAEIDDTLTFGENWHAIKTKYFIRSQKI